MVAKMPRWSSLATTSLAGRLHFSASSLTVTPSESMTMPISSSMYSRGDLLGAAAGLPELELECLGFALGAAALVLLLLATEMGAATGALLALGSMGPVVGQRGTAAGPSRDGRGPPGRAPGPPGRGRQGRRAGSDHLAGDRRGVPPGPLGRAPGRWGAGAAHGPGLGQLDVAGRLLGPGRGRRGVRHLDAGEALLGLQLGDGGRNVRPPAGR